MVFFQYSIRSSELFSIFLNFPLLNSISILPRGLCGFLGLRRKSLNVSADVDAFWGVPQKADFGILTILGDPPISGGRGGGVKFSLLVIYIGRGFGGSSSD